MGEWVEWVSGWKRPVDTPTKKGQNDALLWTSPRHKRVTHTGTKAPMSGSAVTTVASKPVPYSLDLHTLRRLLSSGDVTPSKVCDVHWD